MNPLYEDEDAGQEYGIAADMADGHYQDLPVFPAAGGDDDAPVYGLASADADYQPAYALGAGDDDAYQSLAAVSVPGEHNQPIYSEGAAGDNYQALYSMGAEDQHALEDLIFPLFKKGIARPIDTTGR